VKHLDYDKLIIETSNGDLTSLEQLYNDLKTSVFALAISILRDKTLAEDVLQDTFVRVKLFSNSYRPGTNGRAWILKIARNLALSAIRDRRLETYGEDIEYMESPHNHFVQKSIDSIILNESLSILDEKERQIVLLHAVKDLKHREIADILDLPLGTVLWKYRKAIKKIGAYLKSES
jgi:RNA polymerase sigma-70 factor (ECF subfamily)